MPRRRAQQEPLFRVSSPNASKKNALTASGFKVNKREGDTMRRLVQPWQTRAFSYYDLVPEIKYAAQFYSRSLAVLRLFVGVRGEDGEIVECVPEGSPEAVASEIGPQGSGTIKEGAPTAPPEVFQQLERMQDPGGGGRSGLLAAYGRLRFLTGEAYLFVSRDPDDESEQWEMLSTDELRVQGSNITRYKAPSMEAENFQAPDDEDFEPIDDKTAVAYRLWNRHPRYSFLADSTMQGVLDICEELVLLTQAVRSRVKSRLAGAGILLVNGKVIPAPVEVTPDEDPEEDTFLDDLTEAMTLPIVDEGTASAVVPLVIRVDVEDIDKVMKHIQIVDPTQLYPETGLRYECIKRLSIGLDMPPEILTGMQDSNHWSAWQVDEQTWKAHLQPIAQQLVDDLTSSYFRPSLKNAGIVEWADYVIAFDATEVINHPDRSKDAKDLHDSGAISDAALREAAGFSEADAPSEEEKNLWVGIKLRDASYAKYGIPGLRTGGIEPEAGVVQQGDNSPNNGDTGASVAKAPPTPPAESNSANGKPVTASLDTSAFYAKIIGASDLALLRARELAGTRLRSLAKRDKAVLGTLVAVKNTAVAAKLGPDTAASIGAPPARQLVQGAGDAIMDALRMWEVGDDMAASICARIEQHAARTLYDENPTPMPPSFVDYVIGLHEAVKA